MGAQASTSGLTTAPTACDMASSHAFASCSFALLLLLLLLPPAPAPAPPPPVAPGAGSSENAADLPHRSATRFLARALPRGGVVVAVAFLTSAEAAAGAVVPAGLAA